jgi:drug/metabolite transporter (DMT)-like permease
MNLFYILFTFSLLAGGITINKYILEYFTPVWFVAFRMACAGLILGLYSAKSWDESTRKRLKQDLWIIVLIAICTTFVPTWLKAFGLKYMTAAKTTLLGSIDPFITALYAYLLFGEILTWRKAFGVLLGWIGVLLMVMAPTPQEELWRFWGPVSWPELAALSSTAIARLGWTLTQRLLKQERYQPIQMNTLVMSISGICAMVTALSSHEPVFSHTPKGYGTLFLFLLTVVGAGVIGYAMYANCLKLYSPTLVSLAGFLVPILVALFAWIFLGEPITFSLIMAFIALFAGLALFEGDRRRVK